MQSSDTTPQGDPALWFPTLRLGEPAAVRRLLCVPYAGGSPAMYQRWRSRLADLVDVLPLCPPGRAHRFNEPPLQDVHELADEVAVASAQLCDRPVALFGYSLGALVALEVTRRLTAIGHPPFLLMVAACPPPSGVRQREQYHTLPDEDFIAMLRGLEATPAAILDNQEMVATLLPMLRADFTMAERYVYRTAPQLDTPIVTFAAGADPLAPPGTMPGWRAESGQLRHVDMDGGHLFIGTDEAGLLNQVRRELRRAVDESDVRCVAPEGGTRWTPKS